MNLNKIILVRKTFKGKLLLASVEIALSRTMCALTIC